MYFSRYDKPYPVKPEFVRLASTGPTLEFWPGNPEQTILFYPGTMLAPGHYRLLLESLSHAGFSIAALHLKGHGREKDCSLFTFSDLLAQGLEAETWLLKRRKTKVMACGHSQGGILAVAHAASSRTLAASFALCAVLPQMPEAIDLTLFRRFGRYRQALLTAIRKAAAFLPRFPVLIPMYLSLRRLLKGRCQPLFMGPDHGRLTYPLAYIASLFSAHIPPVLNCPVAIISAKDDALFRPETIAATYEKINAPVKKLVFLERGGHLAPFNPELCQEIARTITAMTLTPNHQNKTGNSHEV